MGYRVRMAMHARAFPSPVGLLRLCVDDDGRLLRIDLPGDGSGHDTPSAPRHKRGDCCDLVARQLEQYFAGTRRDFDLPLAPVGTEFQLAAWAALQAIPFGQTRSYQQQAQAIGRPKAMRAIGAANGKNPLPIVVPCHRVIGKDGSLVGFGGGLSCKQWLLAHEASVLASAHECQRA
jgi:methylated-DNA-[protein]-cysteine S-methyltransferase